METQNDESTFSISGFLTMFLSLKNLMPVTSSHYFRLDGHNLRPGSAEAVFLSEKITIYEFLLAL